MVSRRAACTSVLLLLPLSGCATPRPKSPKKLKLPKADVRPTAFLVKLKLSTKQEAEVEELIFELRERFSQYDETRLVLLDVVLKQIKKGKIDEKALLPLAKKAVGAFEEAKPFALQTLDNFHAVLTPKQRKKFVRMWDKQDDSERTPEQKRAAREAQLASILDLNAGQKTRLYPALVMVAFAYWGTISSMRENLKAAKQAFARDDFRADKLKFFQELDLMEVAHLISDSLQTALDILQPNQRTTLAAYLDARMR